MKPTKTTTTRRRQSGRERSQEITWGESVGKVFIKFALALAPQDENISQNNNNCSYQKFCTKKTKK